MCRELGYPGTTGYLCCDAYGRGNGPVWLVDVACTGTEASLYDCSHNGFGIDICLYQEVGVACETQGMYSEIIIPLSKLYCNYY